MQGELWPSREESAADNLRQAIWDAKGDFVVEWVERGAGGYFVLFRKGDRVHREPQLDPAVLEGGGRDDGGGARTRERARQQDVGMRLAPTTSARR